MSALLDALMFILCGMTFNFFLQKLINREYDQ